MNLLHIDSSALGAHSVSPELRGAVVKEWKRAHAGAKVTYRDVAAQPLPRRSGLAFEWLATDRGPRVFGDPRIEEEAALCGSLLRDSSNCSRPSIGYRRRGRMR